MPKITSERPNFTHSYPRSYSEEIGDRKSLDKKQTAMKEPRIRANKLSELTGIPVQTLLRFFREGKIPGEKFGHRTTFFYHSKVEAALARFEQKEIGADSEATK